jgi:hypothetical protein
MRLNLAFCLLGLLGLIFASSSASAQVEYTRICTVAGQGYFYVPGSDVCLNPMTGKTWQATVNGAVTGNSPMLMSIDRSLEGVAMDAALPTAIIEPGKTFAIAGDLGTFDAYYAAGFGAAVRLNENFQLNAAVGAGFTGHTGVARIGANFSW